MPDINDTHTRQQVAAAGPRTGLTQNEVRPLDGINGIEDQRGATAVPKATPATQQRRSEDGAATPEQRRENNIQEEDDDVPHELRRPQGVAVLEGGDIVVTVRDRNTTSADFRYDETAAGIAERMAGLGSRAAANITHAYHACGEAIKYAVGQLNAVDMLITQHRETESLLQRIQLAKMFDPQSRHRLVEMLCDSLIAHMRIEEEIFYPAMERADVRDLRKVHHSEDEHFEVKRLMSEMLVMDPTDVMFEHKLEDITADLCMHMKEEEEIFFPAARKQIDVKKLKDLGCEMHKRYAELMGQKHPRHAIFEDVGKPVPTEES